MNYIYLCKPGGYKLGILDGIDESNTNLKQSVSDLWELTFDIYRYIDRDGELKEVPYYDAIGEMMELYLESDRVCARFQIDKEPDVSSDGISEYKSVVAHSIEVELQSKMIKNIQINTGLPSSQENLLGFYRDDGEFVNLNTNPYTLLPEDYITIRCNLEQEMRDIQARLNEIDLNVNSSTGLIQNRDVYPYLRKIHRRYSRLNVDLVPVTDSNGNIDVKERSYLVMIDNPLKTDYGFDFFVGHDKEETEVVVNGVKQIKVVNTSPTSYNVSYLKNGIAHLIDFYHEFGNQLSLLDIILENATGSGWTIGEVPERLARMKCSFSIDSQDILSFLMSDLTSTMKFLVDFDRVDKKINLIDVMDETPKYTGVLSKTGWRNSKQTVQITGINSEKSIFDDENDKTETNGIVGVLYDADSAQFTAAINSKVRVCDQGENYITFECKTTPSTDINFGVYIDESEEGGLITVGDHIRAVPSKDLSYDTGVLLSYHNLINSVSVKESNSDGIVTKFFPKGKNDLGIEYVNFGNNYIIDLDWMVDKVNEFDDYQYVSKALHDKYHRWRNYLYNTRVAYNSNSYASRREAYIDVTKEYNKTILDIDEVNNLVPTDGCLVDYLNCSFEELNTYYHAYYSALETVEEAYRNDFGIRDFNRDTLEIWDYYGNPISRSSNPEKFIDNTIYWHDFQCYWKYIIPNVINGLRKYVSTDGTLDLKEINPNQYDQKNKKWIQTQGGNPWYNSNPNDVKALSKDDYKYDMSLYGLKELKAKKQAWAEEAGAAYKHGFILDNNNNVIETAMYDSQLDQVVSYIPNDKYGTTSGKYHYATSYTVGYYSSGNFYYDSNHENRIIPESGRIYIAYNESTTPKTFEQYTRYRYNGSSFTSSSSYKIGWDYLADYQKARFSSPETYARALDTYLDYVSHTSRKNGIRTRIDIHGKEMPEYSIGLVLLPDDRISQLESELATLETKQKNLDNIRKSIITESRIETYHEFTDEECQVLTTMIKEADYSNENNLTTSSETIVNILKSQEGLYQDSVIALSEQARPQLSFDIGTDNLFSIKGFEPISDNINLLNYVRVAIGLKDDLVIKLRIVDIDMNPLVDSEELTLSFSNMTYSIQGDSDLGYLFHDVSGSRGSSGGGSNGGFGDDAAIQLSNNMLKALLRNKEYSHSVGTIMVNQIANDYGYPELKARVGIFEMLEAGDVNISGTCITDHIRSRNYNGGKNMQLINGTQGSYINLADGTFNFGGRIIFDGSSLKITISSGRSGEGDYDLGTKIKITEDNISSEISAREDADTVLSSRIEQKPDSIEMSVENSGTEAKACITITLRDENGELVDSAVGNIIMTGVVTFNGLQNGTTVIDGGCIQTGTISADRIDVADLIQVGGLETGSTTISGDRIETGTISTDSLIAGDLNGFNIKGGSLEIGEIRINPTDGFLSNWFSGLGDTSIQILHGQIIFEQNTYDAGYLMVGKYNNSFGGLYLHGEHELIIESKNLTHIQSDRQVKIESAGQIKIETADKIEIVGSIHSDNWPAPAGNSKIPNVRIDKENNLCYLTNPVNPGTSARKYKHDIRPICNSELDPHKLYDVEIVQFVYNDDFAGPNDFRYHKTLPGMIADDLEQIYPAAVYTEDGQPEGWLFETIIPPMLKLIQEQHEEIEILKAKVAVLEQME